MTNGLKKIEDQQSNRLANWDGDPIAAVRGQKKSWVYLRGIRHGYRHNTKGNDTRGYTE